VLAIGRRSPNAALGAKVVRLDVQVGAVAGHLEAVAFVVIGDDGPHVDQVSDVAIGPKGRGLGVEDELARGASAAPQKGASFAPTTRRAFRGARV